MEKLYVVCNYRSLQKIIGYVPQNIFLSDDTIIANIAFGEKKEKVDIAAVKRASKIANLDKFVSTELPLGYQTVVGDRGIRLSGGQRQRIWIIDRALYHNPKILIFDEATNALDNATEKMVMDEIYKMKDNLV